MNLQLLTSSPLFQGIMQEEIKKILLCLKARECHFQKGEFLYRSGDRIHEFGIVLSGSISIEHDDLWGNRTVLDCIGPGRVFAETYACVSGEALMVNVAALEAADVLFLDMHNLLQVCSSACAYHQRMIRNLLLITAQKNLNLSRRSLHTAPKSIRGRLLSYLSYQVLQQGRRDFRIPFNRQQLADYLNVDRSALSAELSRMQKEGLLRTERNHFVILEQMES